jgi:hypothetical protein
MKSEVWGDRVTIAFGDMRKWQSPEKVRQQNFYNSINSHHCFTF